MRWVNGLVLAVIILCGGLHARAADPLPLAWKWHELDRFEVRSVKHTSTRTVTRSRLGSDETEEETSSSSTLLRIDVVEVREDGRARLLLRFSEFEMEQRGPTSLKLSAKRLPDGKVDATAEVSGGGMEVFAREAEAMLREVGANLLAMRIHVELSGAGEVLSTQAEGRIVPSGEGSPLRRLMAASIERLLTVDDFAQAAVGETFPQLAPKPPAPGARWPVRRVFTLMGLSFAGKGAAFVTSSDPDGAIVTIGEEMIYAIDAKGYASMIEAVVAGTVPGAKVKATLRPENQSLVRYSGKFDVVNGHPLDWSVPRLEMKLVATTTVTLGDTKSTISQRISVAGDVRSTWRRLASPLGAADHAAPASYGDIPPHYVEPDESIGQLGIGERAWIRWNDIRCAPDGTAWFLPSAPMWRTLPPGRSAGRPRLTRAGEKDYDVDLSRCTDAWGLVLWDGEAFEPTRKHTRVRSFTAQDGSAGPVLPEAFRGKRLWELQPDEVGWLGAAHIAVDRNGNGWVDANWAVRARPFADASGPAVAITGTGRDVVKLDVSGVTYWWNESEPPEFADLGGADGLRGHKRSPFAVSSFTRDGRKSATLPRECLAPPIRELAVGTEAFVSPMNLTMDAEHRLWIDGNARAMPRAEPVDWDFAALGVRRIDKETFALDVAGATYRWTFDGPSSEPAPSAPSKEGPAAAPARFRVAEVVDAEKKVGATVPEALRAEPVWSLAPGAVGWTSCRFVGADSNGTGWVAGFAPVRRAPFADEFGPAVALTMEPDRASCGVDLSGATHRWRATKSVTYEPIRDATPDAPRFTFLRVSRFTVTPSATAGPK